MSAKRKHNGAAKEPSNSTKRQRTSSIKEDTADSAPTPATTKSVLSKEQTAFPRGGAGPLTLIEQKQIRAKATRDATREAATNSRDLFTTNDAASDSDDSGMDIDGEVKETKSRATKKSKGSRNETSRSEQSSIRIKSVSFRSLNEDSLLLGRITSISNRGLMLALPNNLSGFVPITSISKQFSEKLAKSLQDDSDHEESEDEADLNLHTIFQIGQALRVRVRKIADDESGKKQNNNRIDLSIEPHLVNTNLSKDNITQGTTVQASVVSVEDHGVILDVGFEDNSTAFCPKKLMPEDINIREGSVILCTVTKAGGKAIQLSADMTSNIVAKSGSSIDAYLPGTLAEVLLTDIEEDGFIGKILGLLDATADSLHSSASLNQDDLKTKYSIGQKVKARIVANFPQADHKRVAVSVLDTTLNLRTHHCTTFGLSDVVNRAQVMTVAHGLGCYFSLPGEVFGFCHISRLQDGAVDNLGAVTGPFKVGTEHQARVLDYNSIDGLFTLTLQKSVIDQPFLRLEDIKDGQVVTGKIEKVLIGATGVRGVLLKLAAGINGIVSAIHLSDADLKHPERKFREGAEVKARVLSVDLTSRKLDLTLKKSLVNSDQPIWSDWNSINVGSSTIGTLIKVEALWAIVQFFGNVKGRLPVSEMSEAFIKDAKEHFKVGQVLAVHALQVNSEAKKLLLTARETGGVSNESTELILPGTLATAIIFEKSADDLKLRLEPSNVTARLSIDHVQDGSEKKRKSALEKLRVGQKLQDLLVLEVKGRSVVLSNKASLRKAAEEGKLIKSYADLKEDAIVTGYISNITEHKVFVRFAQGITGVINEAQIPDEWKKEADFGIKVMQPVSAKVVQIDYKGATPRFWLSLKANTEPSKQISTITVENNAPSDAIDSQTLDIAGLSLGSVTKARITSVKDTQLNVQLAKDVQGRVDVSEVFDTISDIPDRKSPLKHFTRNQIVEVKILGQHDSRSYKFLPLSHRKSKNTVFELSAKPSTLAETSTSVIKLEDMKVGDKQLAFVNNVTDNALMVNVSPAVRGRIAVRNLTNDFAILANLGRAFPVGCAIESEVVAIDLEKNRLDLSTKLDSNTKTITIDNISTGDIVAGKVTKTTERSVVVQLSDTLVAVVDLVDIADNYELADPSRFEKGEIVRAYVVRVDAPNRKINLSLRPSKILSSGIDPEDPELTLDTINVGDVRRGFIHNISDKGIFVTLGHGLTAFVRITNLSDEYLKEWQDHFQRGQLVKGKITLVDRDSGHTQMSLRRSHVDGTYQSPITIKDLEVGQVVQATIAKVESFGVFIVVDNSENVRGLCHRSEIADKRIEDVTKIGFSAGDKVKAKVLKIEAEQKRINFGMKASYFADESEDEMSVENDSDEEQSDVISEMDNSSDAGVELAGSDSDAEEVEEGKTASSSTAQALTTGGFDWFGVPSNNDAVEKTYDEENSTKPKKNKKKQLIEDRTGDLDRDGPQSSDDFERLLLSQPDNAVIWIQFMAFHVDLGDIDAARLLASKALSSIGLANEAAKKAIWIALFNIENEFGDADSLQSTLEKACQTMDTEDMHTSLASIYIRSGKLEKADDLFQTILKKFTQNPKTWLNYATFLFDNLEEPVRARALLPRALQALPPFTHFDTTRQFAQLEFKTKTGVPEEGRTRFQGLISLYPKRIDLFNVMIDHEIKLGDAEQVRSVFEQVLSKDLKPAKVKPFFKRWLEFEKSIGEDKKADEVQSRAAKWVSQYNATKEAAVAT